MTGIMAKAFAGVALLLVAAGVANANLSGGCGDGFFDGSIVSQVGSPSLSLTRRALNVVGGAFPDWPGIKPSMTFFAPTNQAWVQAATYLDTNIEGLFGEPKILEEMLLLHIVPSNPINAFNGVKPIYTDELKDGDALTSELGEGLNVQVAYYEKNLKAVYISVADGAGPGACLPEAKLIDINFPVCGGTISVHVVSQVLLPKSCDIFPTIEEIVFDTPELSLLAEAFAVLDAEGIALPGRTQFAPTNLAFNRAFLLLGTNKNAVFNNIDLLQDLVKYNRVVSELPLCQLTDGKSLTTDAIGSFSPKSNFLLPAGVFTLNVSIRSVLERLCGGQLANLYVFRRIIIVGNLTSARVLVPDIQACDGRVYITDQVLLPPTFFFDFTVMDIICSSTILSTLCSVIRDTPLSTVLDLLSDANSKTLVFAPTNFAFSSALHYLRIENPGEAELNVVILYHAVGLTASDSIFTYQWRNDVDAYENLAKKDLNIVVNGVFPLEGFFVDGGCNRVQVLVPLSNRLAVNGIVHVVDRVILPSNDQLFCPSTCERLELNPLTTVFVAAIYALGLEYEYCTKGASNTSTNVEPPRLTSGTVFAPTDLAFAKYFFQGGYNIFTLFQSYPEQLYDILLYHTVSGSSILTGDIFDGKVLSAPSGTVLNTGFPPNANGHISTPTTLLGRRFDSYTFIRKNLLRSVVFVEGDRCPFLPPGASGANCAGRIIVPDQRTISGTVVQTIDQVLTPPILVCQDPLVVTSTTAISVVASVSYVGPVGCSLFCVGHLARCLPCSPFAAQEIWTSEVDANPLDTASGIVYTLYVNQLGEVRWGQVPGLVKSLWDGSHAIGPVGLVKAGTSIVAQGFLATNLKNFNVIAVAQDVTPIGGSSAKDTALLKIYIDGYLKGAAAVDFTAIISLADIQFQIHQILSTYVIQKPILSIRAANYPGPEVRPSGAGILGSSLIGPFEGATVSLVDADDLEDGDSALDDALSDANSTIAAMAAMGENAVNAQTLYYAIRTGINPIQGIQELFDGMDGVGYYEVNGFPDVLKETDYYKDCGPIWNQYKNVPATGSKTGVPPCGYNAIFFQGWAGIIFRLSVYNGVEVFPSQCIGQPFGRPVLL